MATLGIFASQITATPKTANPVIYNISASPPVKIGSSWNWNVTNKDTSTAEIFSEVGDSTPDVSKGTASYNNNVSCSQLYPTNSGTVYAYAVASGKSDSDIVGVYFGGGI